MEEGEAGLRACLLAACSTEEDESLIGAAQRKGKVLLEHLLEKKKQMKELRYGT